MKLLLKLFLLLLAIPASAEPFSVPQPGFLSSEFNPTSRSLSAGGGGGGGGGGSGGGYYGSSSSNEGCDSKACYIFLACFAAGAVIIALYDICRVAAIVVWICRRMRRRAQNPGVREAIPIHVDVERLKPQTYTSAMLQYGFSECSICLMT
jgi:uncharacterized membrane protein